MRKHTIYFEIFGKKLKTTVMANNEREAKELIKNKIIFHKIQAERDVGFDIFDFLTNKTK